MASCAAPKLEVRTASHPAVSPVEALEMLKQGNQRYIEGSVMRGGKGMELRDTLATDGQNPAAVVIACADSRCPLEILFDAQPGDLFVLRNAGNTCTHAEGSIVGSVEYSTGHLRTRLVVVLGHTKCGAIAGACKTMMANKDHPQPAKKNGGKRPTALETLLAGLAPVAEEAASQLPKGASVDEIAVHAIKVNVFHTMDRLLQFSEGLRERVRRREVEVHGAIYDLTDGRVDFLGQSPNLGKLVDSAEPPPPVTRRYGVDSAHEEEMPAAGEAAPQEGGQGKPSLGHQEEGSGKKDAKVSNKMQRWFQYLRF